MIDVENFEENVLMTFVEAKGRSNIDFMALVEEISPDPKPVSVPQEIIEGGFLFSESESLVARAFEVDLEVVKKDGDIIRYRLLKIQGKLL